MTWRAKIASGTAVEGWKDRITVHDSNVCVALSNANLSDADLEPLMKYLDALLTDHIWPTHWTYSLDLDLSCNCGITDFGVTVHIVCFLGKWPACRRLKLYQTSIGDGTLQALSPWVASGNAHELHLSDLCGTVTGTTVLQLIRDIHWKGNYPYWTNRGDRAALWLRLEHNGIPHPEELVATAQADGIWVGMVDKSDLSTVRPGAAVKRGPHCNASINLVLFRMQNRKPAKQHDNVNTRQSLLAMLHVDEPSRVVSRSPPFRAEPQPLSVDEFKLWTMEAREDQESGANACNKDTFGDDADVGWTFEENLAANERLAIQTEEAKASIETARAGRKARVGCGDVRQEIEEEVQVLLAVSPVLRRFDFDGPVRQHLHAIRTTGGQQRVQEAMYLIHGATRDKERRSIQKWPAYLLKLLKGFLRSPKVDDYDDYDYAVYDTARKAVELVPVPPLPVFEYQ